MINIHKKYTLLAFLGTIFINPAFAATISVENEINQQLIQMESPAEDMFEELNEPTVLNRHYKTISKAMNNLNELNSNRDLIDNLSKNIAIQNSWFLLISIEMEEMDDLPALAYAVNQFSGQLIISTQYESGIEKNISWMDYLGRELLILNEYPSDEIDNKNLIVLRKNDLQSTWNSIKVTLLKKENGGLLAQKVDPLIHKIVSETDKGLLVTLAQEELEIVDSIEEFFHIN